MAAYTGPERRLHERRSNWAHAVETLQRDLIDDLLALAKTIRTERETLWTGDEGYLCDRYGTQLAAIIRRHQVP